jgi:hypothetical protein
MKLRYNKENMFNLNVLNNGTRRIKKEQIKEFFFRHRK